MVFLLSMSRRVSRTRGENLAARGIRNARNLVRRVRPSADDSRISRVQFSLSALPPPIQCRLREASSSLLRDLTFWPTAGVVGALRPLPHLFERDLKRRASVAFARP